MGNFTANDLLASLPLEELKRLEPHLQPVRLAKGTILHDIDETVSHVYFPLAGMVSLLGVTADGDVIELSAVGREGLVGLSTVCRTDTAPYQAVVQIAGEACRIRAPIFASEFRRGGYVQQEVLGYMLRLLTQTFCLALCHRFHTVEQRLCRYLLTTRDCLRSDAIELTQEAIGRALAVQRTAISAAAIVLQDRQIIRQRHGRIQILNRPKLEAGACPCYRVVRSAHAEYQRKTQAHPNAPPPPLHTAETRRFPR